jgi:hypothetical protein
MISANARPVAVGDLLARPLLSVFRNGRIIGRAEDDVLCLMESRVVLNPLTLMKIATMPKRISTPPARNPPISSSLCLHLLHLPSVGCCAKAAVTGARAIGEARRVA